MGGTSKRAAFGMVGATVMLVMSVASAGAGPSAGPEVMGRIESSSQKEILDRGLKVLVSNKGAGHSMVDVRGLLQHLRRSGFHAADEDAGSPAEGTEGFGPDLTGQDRAPATHGRGAQPASRSGQPERHRAARSICARARLRSRP